MVHERTARSRRRESHTSGNHPNHKWMAGPFVSVGLVLVLASAAFAYQLTISGSMEGDLNGFLPGAWVSAGYHFDDGQAGVPVTFNNAELELEVSCTHNGSVVAGDIVVPLANGPYNASGSGTYVPWTDQASTNPLPYQGAVQAPNLCPSNPNGLMYSAGGVPGGNYAIFSADVTSTSTTPISVQFHYRVPDAKNPMTTTGHADGVLNDTSTTATSASLFAGSAAYAVANNDYLITDSEGLIPPGTSIVTGSENNTTHTVTLSQAATGNTTGDTFTVIQNTDCDNPNDPNALSAAVCQASLSSNPSVTPDIVTTIATMPTSSTIVLGNSNTDTVTVTGNSNSGSPTGTVSFYACGPDASQTDCTSQSNEVGTAKTLHAGANDTATATSASFTPTSTGYWCFAGYYSGDSNYPANSDTSTDECFHVTAASSTAATSPTQSSVVYGGSNTDGVTVSGNSAGGSPTGTVSFYVCGPTASPTACTSQADEVGRAVSLTAQSGAKSTASSSPFTPYRAWLLVLRRLLLR